MQLKVGMANSALEAIYSEKKDRESIAFTRYADKVRDPAIEEGMQIPRGEPFRRIDVAGELFRVQKTANHWAEVSRGK